VQPVHKPAADAEEYLTPEGCWILEVANDADDEAASVARARVEPGVSTEWHLLRNTAERYLILQGRGRVEIGESPSFEVAIGDVVRIPADIRQRISNIGDDDLIFYCVCTPRFKAANYRSLS
jgi:mannose-6-phosphate isomerase-like protein (cupin superfamily)